MKRLWKHIPPCLSDVMGFQAIMTQTDGLGIVDDPGRYKPLATLGVGNAKPMYMSAGRPDMMTQSRGGFGGERGGHGGFGGGHEGRGGHGDRGGRGNGGGRGAVAQVTDSALRNEDIISGTEKKIVQAYENNKGNNPKFVLVTNAPSSAMISSDIETAAIKIGESGNIPTGCVKIYGEKDYLYGASLTMEALAKLLAAQAEKKPDSVNILGCNIVDWGEEAVSSLEKLLADEGISVICKWGAAGMTAESIKESSKASLNLVVNISGLRAAQYMQKEFGIPYVVGAPYGKAQTEELMSLVKNALKDSDFEKGSCSINKGAEPESFDAVVMGEQLMANAIRRVLKENGCKNVRVLSFFEMDKNYMEPGDKKIASEDELAELTAAEGLRLIAANPDYKGAVKNELKWVNLPNSGMSIMTKIDPVDMIGSNLDEWTRKLL